MQVRNYSKRTIKTSYNSTLKFITYCSNEFRNGYGIKTTKNGSYIYLTDEISENVKKIKEDIQGEVEINIDILCEYLESMLTNI